MASVFNALWLALWVSSLFFLVVVFGDAFFFLARLFISSGVAKRTRWCGVQVVVVRCGSFSRFFVVFQHVMMMDNYGSRQTDRYY